MGTSSLVPSSFSSHRRLGGWGGTSAGPRDDEFSRSLALDAWIANINLDSVSSVDSVDSVDSVVFDGHPGEEGRKRDGAACAPRASVE